MIAYYAIQWASDGAPRPSVRPPYRNYFFNRALFGTMHRILTQRRNIVMSLISMRLLNIDADANGEADDA